MIRTNLASRPFYNERRLHLWLALMAALVVAATLFNVARIVEYSRSDTELKAKAAADEARAAELRRDAAQLRAGVDVVRMNATAAEANLANGLIARRTFSWIELLNHFNDTLPDAVRVTSATPRVESAQRVLLSMSVQARSISEIDRFMENLEATGAFSDMLSREERVDEDGVVEASIEGIYAPTPRGEQVALSRTRATP